MLLMLESHLNNEDRVRMLILYRRLTLNCQRSAQTKGMVELKYVCMHIGGMVKSRGHPVSFLPENFCPIASIDTRYFN